MVEKMICFDMDGTLADLYNVPGWLEKLQAEDASPYTDAYPLVDMIALRRVLLTLIDQGWQIRVISWLAKNSSENYKAKVRKAKREWLSKYGFPVEHAHLIAYGTTKADCVRKIVDGCAILVDDDASVRNGWHLGDTINPEEENIITRLCALID